MGIFLVGFLVLFGFFFSHVGSALLPLSGSEVVSALRAQEGLLISLVYIHSPPFLQVAATAHSHPFQNL